MINKLLVRVGAYTGRIKTIGYSLLFFGILLLALSIPPAVSYLNVHLPIFVGSTLTLIGAIIINVNYFFLKEYANKK